MGTIARLHPALREPTGTDIARILQLAAPSEVLTSLVGPGDAAATEFARALEDGRVPPASAGVKARRRARHGYASIAGVALYYATRRPAAAKRGLLPILSAIAAPADVLFAFAREMEFQHDEAELPALESALQKGRKLSVNGRRAANAKLNQRGGYNERAQKVKQAWASGAYGGRNECAEAVASKLGISFDTAREHLKNEPDPPPPWAPSRRKHGASCASRS